MFWISTNLHHSQTHREMGRTVEGVLDIYEFTSFSNPDPAAVYASNIYHGHAVLSLFWISTNLHHSQTTQNGWITNTTVMYVRPYLFWSYTKLHYSQTQELYIHNLPFVLELYEITPFSNR